MINNKLIPLVPDNIFIKLKWFGYTLHNDLATILFWLKDNKNIWVTVRVSPKDDMWDCVIYTLNPNKLHTILGEIKGADIAYFQGLAYILQYLISSNNAKK